MKATGFVPTKATVAAMALGVCIRLVVIPLGSGTERFSNIDTESYAEVARRMPTVLWAPDQAILDYSLQRTPVYPTFMWLVGGGGVNLTATVVVQCVIGGAVNVWLCAVLGRRIFGRSAGVAAAFVLALDPISIGHSLLVGTETIFTTTVLLGVLAVERAWALRTAPLPQAALMMVAGLLIGVGALTRPALLFLAPVVAVVWVLAVRTKAAVVRALMVVASAALLIGLWYVRNEQATGTWLFSTAQGQNLFDYGAAAKASEEGLLRFGMTQPDEANTTLTDAGIRLAAEHPGEIDMADVVARDAAWQRIGVEAIREHPRGYLTVAVQSLAKTVAGPGHSLLLQEAGQSQRGVVAGLTRGAAVCLLAVDYLLAAVGGGVLVRRRRWATITLLALPVVYYLGISAGPQMYARFRVPIMPLVAVVAGGGFVRTLSWVGHRSRSRTESDS